MPPTLLKVIFPDRISHFCLELVLDPYICLPHSWDHATYLLDFTINYLNQEVGF
jgi:hypothetical protein